MPKLPVISGSKLIKILIKYFDFRVLRQRGSHVTNSRSTKFDSLMIKNTNHSFIGKEKELAKKISIWIRNLNL